MDEADFYGYYFETGFMLFADDFQELAGVYIVYTPKNYLEIGTTEHLKTTLETHPHTRDWINLSGSRDILIAFHPETDAKTRTEVKKYLSDKMEPILREN